MKTITWEEILNVSSDKYKYDVVGSSVCVQYLSSLILKLIEHEWITKSKICLDEGIFEKCKANGWYIYIKIKQYHGHMKVNIMTTIYFQIFVNVVHALFQQKQLIHIYFIVPTV